VGEGRLFFFQNVKKRFIFQCEIYNDAYNRDKREIESERERERER